MNGKKIRLPRLLAALIFILGAASARAATEYTGDTIQGVRVISRLDVDDLAPGKKISVPLSRNSDGDRPALVHTGHGGEGRQSRQESAAGGGRPRR
jgi:hypothetical protein